MVDEGGNVSRARPQADDRSDASERTDGLGLGWAFRNFSIYPACSRARYFLTAFNCGSPAGCPVRSRAENHDCRLPSFGPKLRQKRGYANEIRERNLPRLSAAAATNYEFRTICSRMPTSRGHNGRRVTRSGSWRGDFLPGRRTARLGLNRSVSYRLDA